MRAKRSLSFITIILIFLAGHYFGSNVIRVAKSTYQAAKAEVAKVQAK